MNLCVFYPHRPVPPWQVVSSILLLAGLTVLCLRQARSRPWLLVGWAWFCVMLLPVIGLVQVGWQARADRYTYLPLIGVFILSWAWGAGRIPSALPRLATRPGAGRGAGPRRLPRRDAPPRLKHWQNSDEPFPPCARSHHRQLAGA